MATFVARKWIPSSFRVYFCTDHDFNWNKAKNDQGRIQMSEGTFADCTARPVSTLVSDGTGAAITVMCVSYICKDTVAAVGWTQHYYYCRLNGYHDNPPIKYVLNSLPTNDVLYSR